MLQRITQVLHGRLFYEDKTLLWDKQFAVAPKENIFIREIRDFEMQELSTLTEPKKDIFVWWDIIKKTMGLSLTYKIWD